ncbi:hypothetical protein POTOM_024726 [Populus tomentosa]|uniref:Haloacid dehalogenase-like hydrolase superfamily protein n=1 Tax=Populus tomentosa TaxID=118781 RepID=A0A8X7ZHZ1_POPTO|nr:hypothetical protein POTOM_024726 [Populus tomentosa]
MATAGTKLTRVLSRFFINNVNNKPLRVMGSGSSFNGLAKYSTSASTAVKDYEDYRKSLYGDISHRALLVDAVGTLVAPSQPMAQVSKWKILGGVSRACVISEISFQLKSKAPISRYIRAERSVCRLGESEFVSFMDSIYRQIGEKYGVEYSEDEILNRYRWAYGQPWGRSRLRLLFLHLLPFRTVGVAIIVIHDTRFIMCNKYRIITCKLLETAAATAYNAPTDDSSRQTMVIVLRSFANLLRWSTNDNLASSPNLPRYVNDGRPFWQFIVSSSTGCSDARYFEELYSYYTTEKAWHLCDPDAEKVFEAIRKAGVKLAVVSNFDTRLRPLLRALNCDHWFDAVAVSAEVAAEKPNPTIFLKACELLEVKPEDVVHVGDDRRNDIWGARDAGCDAWLWGSDVHSFEEVAQRIGVPV